MSKACKGKKVYLYNILLQDSSDLFHMQ